MRYGRCSLALLLALILSACATGSGKAGPPVQSYEGKAAIPAELPVDIPKATLAAADAAPRIGPQVRVDKGTSFSVETAALSLSPSEVFAAWYDGRQIPGTPNTLTRLAMAASQDGGRTWTESLLDVHPELLSRIAADPMFTYDPRTGTAWLGGVSLGSNAGVFIYRKDAGASTFGPPITVIKNQGVDKPWMAAAADPQDPTKTRLYITHNLGLQISTDLGNTWSAPVPLGEYPAFQPRTGPNGELYIAYWDLADGVMLRRSFDGGRTLSAPIRAATRRDFWPLQQAGSRFPGKFRAASFAYLAVDPRNGTLYVVYFDTTSVVNGRYDVDLYMTRSTDRGTTWSTPKVINGDATPPGDQFFPWIEVDAKGRIHVVFYDTRNTPQEDGSAEAWIDAYYTVSADGGATWSEHRLTPASFSSFSSPPTGILPQFIGDYNALTVSGDRAWPVYMSTQSGQSDIYTHEVALASSATCVTDDESLCLNNGRFRARVTWTTKDGSGPGHAVPLTADSGYFWFFNAANVELLVKVLDACVPPYNAFWIYSAGLTDQGVRLVVEDLRTGEVKEYRNPRGTAYPPKLDSNGFRTCGAP